MNVSNLECTLNKAPSSAYEQLDRSSHTLAAPSRMLPPRIGILFQGAYLLYMTCQSVHLHDTMLARVRSTDARSWSWGSSMFLSSAQHCPHSSRLRRRSPFEWCAEQDSQVI